MKNRIAVIGGGPGGYTAAFRLADLGRDVTIIGSRKTAGGVCLYNGCIPSKTLLHSIKILNLTEDAQKMGIYFSEPSIDIEKLQLWKNNVIERNSKGLSFLCRKKNVQYVQGNASFVNNRELLIETGNGEKITRNYDKIIISTGSIPVIPDEWNPGTGDILDSTSALNLEKIPGSMLVIGGGAIGLEIGTIYSMLGTRISVVEIENSLLPGIDNDLVSPLLRTLKKKFQSIMLNSKVTVLRTGNSGIEVEISDKEEKKTLFVYEKVLVSIGRKPNSGTLSLENTNITTDQTGFIEVDDNFQTGDKNIYAIGDVVSMPMLAHKASYEGKSAAEHIVNNVKPDHRRIIPAVVYTDPEVAVCGLSETEAKKISRLVKVIRNPWTASGRAVTLDRTDGVTKLIIDPDTNVILGMGITGVDAGELIAQGVIAVEKKLTLTELRSYVYPHPTLSETITR